MECNMLDDAVRRDLIAGLEAHQGFDDEERGHAARIAAFVRRVERPFSRETLEGHITAAAIVWRRDTDELLTVWHKKLGKWLQPGGHCEPDVDDSVVGAALRELEEETGVTRRQVTRIGTIFDVDAHPIPETKKAPAHVHYDVRFLFLLVDTSRVQLTADHGAKWTAVSALGEGYGRSLARVGLKLGEMGLSV
jgi:8-oxo-dGTP pyrophosphatase MutT (NUDIX family)